MNKSVWRTKKKIEIVLDFKLFKLLVYEKKTGYDKNQS